MANVLTIVIHIFAVIGLLALTGVVLYYAAKQIQKYKPSQQSQPDWPDDTYMEKVGARCPTGWVYTGQSKSGENVCQNYYNVPVPSPDVVDSSTYQCYDDPSFDH